MNPTTGLALWCDMDGNIVDIIHNPPNLGVEIQVGMLFPRLAASGSLAKALSFLTEVQFNHAAFDWEINIASSDGVKTLRFVGGKVRDHILVAGSEDEGAAQKIYREIMHINNEQTDSLRSTLKQNAYERSQYDEISRLNNELVTLQRELASKNAELERLYSDAKKMAVLDSLTGIYNRWGFFEMGTHEVEHANRFDRPLSLLMFDIDHFKTLNDNYGHTVGDAALKEVVARCSQQLRKVDIFGRYGGEEFVVILPETNLEDACRVAERIRKSASNPMQINQNSLIVTISIGIVSRKDDRGGLGELISCADQAMYKAKQAGRNRVMTG